MTHHVSGGAIFHAGEAGWREEGQNGFIWSFSTPGEQGVRYYEHDNSRGQAVVNQILGEEFHDYLASDFYVGYKVVKARGNVVG